MAAENYWNCLIYSCCIFSPLNRKSSSFQTIKWNFLIIGFAIAMICWRIWSTPRPSQRPRDPPTIKKNSCHIYFILYDITYYTRRPKNKLALLRPMIYTLYNIHEGIIEIEHPYSVSLVTGCHNQVQVTYPSLLC